jgi:peptidyl-prolyl cis-trans isomerase SurA
MKTLFLFLAALMGLSVAAHAQFAPPKEGDKLDAVVAVVGKHPIFKSAIDAQTQLFLMQRGLTNAGRDTLMKLRQQVLQTEIDQKLLLAKADEDSITVTEQEVDDQLNQLIKGYVGRLGSEAAVEREFGRSIAELKSSPDLRERTRENLIVQRERYKVVPAEQSASRADVEAFYRMYKDSLPRMGESAELATIVKLVKPLPNQKERSKAFAQSLIDSLHNGADFATLAKRYSQHTTAAAGGDLGAYYARGTFLPAFEEAAFKLKQGEVSDVVETDQGFHIIKLIDRRGEEIRLAQILIKPTTNAGDELAVRDTLLKLRDRAMHGEDFSKLATQYSDDEETKAFGGSLGHVRLEELAPEQRSVIDSMKDGEVSEPIHIGYSGGRTGFQIVKLVRKVPAHTISLSEDYRDLEAGAMQWKQQQAIVRWLAEARKSIYINVHDLSAYY